MSKSVQLAVIGGGLIGKRHIEHIIAEPQSELYAIVDPAPVSEEMAKTKGVRWYPNFGAMIAAGKPDGVIVATPNQMHVDNGLEAIAAGIPALIEKPIAEDIAGGLKMIEAAERSGTPILTGHHRRHNPMIQRAKAFIEDGRLGQIVAVHGFFWLMKPDEYFDVPWRREIGAGPVLLNLIHDVDLLRYLCGEVKAVQAFQSNLVRRYPVDETTVIILKFVNGALGTMSVSDSICRALELGADNRRKPGLSAHRSELLLYRWHSRFSVGAAPRTLDQSSQAQLVRAIQGRALRCARQRSSPPANTTILQSYPWRGEAARLRP